MIVLGGTTSNRVLSVLSTVEKYDVNGILIKILPNLAKARCVFNSSAQYTHSHCDLKVSHSQATTSQKPKLTTCAL